MSLYITEEDNRRFEEEFRKIAAATYQKIYELITDKSFIEINMDMIIQNYYKYNRKYPADNKKLRKLKLMNYSDKRKTIKKVAKKISHWDKQAEYANKAIIICGRIRNKFAHAEVYEKDEFAPDSNDICVISSGKYIDVDKEISNFYRNKRIVNEFLRNLSSEVMNYRGIDDVFAE